MLLLACLPAKGTSLCVCPSLCALPSGKRQSSPPLSIYLS